MEDYIGRQLLDQFRQLNDHVADFNEWMGGVTDQPPAQWEIDVAAGVYDEAKPAKFDHEWPTLNPEDTQRGPWEQDILNDPVNHPSHYTSYKGIEVIQLTEQMNFNRGNAVKYIARAGLKSKDTEIQDLEKARFYITREIERMDKERTNAP